MKLLTLVAVALCSSSSCAFMLIPISQTTPLVALSAQSGKQSNNDHDIYRQSKVKEENFDTIVIGSGIGGLSAASLLAQAGKKVLVLEQHYVAGGCCHTFKSNGYRFATGLHYVGEMDEQKKSNNKNGLNVKDLIDSLTSADDPIIWDRMKDHFETVVLGDLWNRYEIVRGEENLKLKLKERFPKEKKAIDKYYKLVKRARSSMNRSSMIKSLPRPIAKILTLTGLHRFIDGGFHKWTNTSLQAVLENLTKNKDLQALLAYNWADYGTDPSRAPFFMHACVASHFLDGGYYPHGGPNMIPEKIIKLITDCGGKVLVSANVKRIVVDDETKKAKGVEMMDGTIIESESVVSDAGFMNTVNQLIPPGLIDIDFGEDDRAEDGKLHPDGTGINIFVGLKGDHKSLHLPDSQYWIYPSNDVVGSVKKVKELSLDDALKLDPQDLSPIFIGSPSSKDKAWASEYPDKSVLEIITMVPWNWFEKFKDTFDKKTKSHGPEFEKAKLELAEKVWSRVYEVLERTGATIPKTLQEVDHFQVGTPLSFGYFLNAEHGSWYGLDHDMKRFEPKNFYLRLRPDVPEIPGLYITGQDAAVGGVFGAAMGGMFCAQKVLGVANPLSLIRTKSENNIVEDKYPTKTQVSPKPELA